MLFQTLRFFFKDLFLSLSLGAAILLNLGMWIFLFVVMPAPMTQAFLHSTVYFGIDWTGAWYQIFFFPLAGMAVGIGNNILATITYKNYHILAYFLASTAVTFQIILFGEALFLWRLNG
ncbi:MAG: hypothetical protein AAB444_00600 [Patescibacteria group bacterium]